VGPHAGDGRRTLSDGACVRRARACGRLVPTSGPLSMCRDSNTAMAPAQRAWAWPCPHASSALARWRLVPARLCAYGGP